MKTCTLCKQTKPKTDFGKHKQKKDGLSSWCKPCANAKAAKYNSNPINKLKKAAYDKKRLQDPSVKAKVQTQNRLNYLANKKQKLEQIQKWQKANPEKVTAYKKNNKYKRRELVNSSTLTATELSAWEAKQLKICSYCNKDCSMDYQVDHIDPLTKGGTHELSNLAIACPSCNRSKSDRTLIVWYAIKTIRS